MISAKSNLSISAYSKKDNLFDRKQSKNKIGKCQDIHPKVYHILLNRYEETSGCRLQQTPEKKQSVTTYAL